MLAGTPGSATRGCSAPSWRWRGTPARRKVRPEAAVHRLVGL